ncbi:unnamed protein product [Ceratitis capitata]|uniref:(Mediterranean fruit fly) hypothetical protein n=1 Tax=Ceratitis capitata TaxID=7213 RepID=A0A811UC22_CERCA|nr:unnamed protein product [Ceratitis capitata]
MKCVNSYPLNSNSAVACRMLHATCHMHASDFMIRQMWCCHSKVQFATFKFQSFFCSCDWLAATHRIPSISRSKAVHMYNTYEYMGIFVILYVWIAIHNLHLPTFYCHLT